VIKTNKKIDYSNILRKKRASCWCLLSKKVQNLVLVSKQHNFFGEGEIYLGLNELGQISINDCKIEKINLTGFSWLRKLALQSMFGIRYVK
jgi:hypothetical protein